MKIANDNPKLSFLRKQESRVVGCEKEKTKILDPLLDWIPDQVGDRRRGQASRMTEGDKADPFLRQTLRKTQGVLRTGALLRTSAALRQSRLHI